MATRVVGKLVMADHIEVSVDRARHVAFHDLHVVNVVLDLHTRRSGSLDRIPALAGPENRVAGNVDRVDRFEQHSDIRTGNRVCGELEIVDQGFLHICSANARRRLTCKNGQPFATKRLRVFNRRAYPILKLPDTVGQCRDAALTRRPVASRKVEQHLFQAVLIEFFPDLLCWIVVREEILDALEPGICRCPEPVEHIDLGEHHRKVCGKLGHRSGILVRNEISKSNSGETERASAPERINNTCSPGARHTI